VSLPFPAINVNEFSTKTSSTPLRLRESLVDAIKRATECDGGGQGVRW